MVAGGSLVVQSAAKTPPLTSGRNKTQRDGGGAVAGAMILFLQQGFISQRSHDLPNSATGWRPSLDARGCQGVVGAMEVFVHTDMY